jgi:hypothetical protein
MTVGDWSNRNVTFDHNVYWKTDGSRDLRIGNLPLDQWRAQGMDQHSVVSDPKFADAAGGNFNLQSDSPALVVGFVPFDQSDVGPK